MWCDVAIDEVHKILIWLLRFLQYIRAYMKMLLFQNFAISLPLDVDVMVECVVKKKANGWGSKEWEVISLNLLRSFKMLAKKKPIRLMLLLLFLKCEQKKLVKWNFAVDDEDEAAAK